MEIITATASAIAGWMLTGAFQKAGGELGTKLITAIREKLQAAGTLGLLTRAEKQQTKQNIKIVEGELVTQMTEDEEFAKKLGDLVEQLKKAGVIPDNSGTTNGDTYTFNDEVKGSAFGKNPKVNNKWT